MPSMLSVWGIRFNFFCILNDHLVCDDDDEVAMIIFS